jgi:uncharacterized protein YqhQ
MEYLNNPNPHDYTNLILSGIIIGGIIICLGIVAVISATVGIVANLIFGIEIKWNFSDLMITSILGILIIIAMGILAIIIYATYSAIVFYCPDIKRLIRYCCKINCYIYCYTETNQIVDEEIPTEEQIRTMIKIAPEYGTNL